MAFSYNTFGELLSGLDASIPWFESLRLKVTGTRLEQLRSRVSELMNEMKSLPPGEVVGRWSNNETYYALSDAAGFGRITREMSKIGPNLLPRRKLKIILSGPMDPTAEDPSDESVNARNIFAELDLASDFSEKGIKPTGFDDVEFSFGGTPVHIECKRLHSPRQVLANITKAASQLSKVMTTDHSRGFIALVLDRITGADRLVLRAEAEGDQLTTAAKLSQDFIDRCAGDLDSSIDTRIIGAILLVRFLVYSVPRNIVGVSYNLSFYPYAWIDSRDRRLVEEIAKQLSARARRRSWPPPNISLKRTPGGAA